MFAVSKRQKRIAGLDRNEEYVMKMKRIKAAILDGILCWIWTIIFLEIILLIGIDLSAHAARNKQEMWRNSINTLSQIP